MNQTVVAIVVGIAAAAGTVLLMDNLQARPQGGGGAAVDFGPLEARLEAIERRLPAEGASGGLQGGGALAGVLERLERIEAALQTGGGVAAPGAPGTSGSPLERIEQRLASIEEKVDRGGDGKPSSVVPRRKKRVSLREAADELELTTQQEDELRRIYDAYNERMFKIAAGKDGDPEAIRRDVAEARKDPTKAMGMMSKYLPNMMADIGGVMQASTERDAALRRTLGPDKARRLQRDYDVQEANPLGFGGEMRMESTLGSER